MARSWFSGMGQNIEVPLESVRRATIFFACLTDTSCYNPAQQHPTITLVQDTLAHIRTRSVLVGLDGTATPGFPPERIEHIIMYVLHYGSSFRTL